MGAKREALCATQMKIAIVDYGSGNLRSAAKSFEKAAESLDFPADIHVTSDPERVSAADRIVLPGVGAFADCKAGLQRIAGLWDTLETAVRVEKRPFLGICVGMQLMATTGLEHGSHEGFGWIDGQVEPIAPDDPGLKIPHMGWNTLKAHQSHPILAGLEDGTDVYFVHSYHMRLAKRSNLVASTYYGTEITSIIAEENMVGTQFHPEKSQDAGLRLIGNFLRWTP